MSIHSTSGPLAGVTPLAAAGDSSTPSPSPSSSADGEPSPFAKVLRGLGEELEHGEKFMHDAKNSLAHGNLGPAQLLSIQEGVYRYGLTVDLTSKVVAETTSGVKTIIQSQ